MTKAYNLHLHQLDVDSAFLYADLDEDVYLTPPSGMEIQREGFCLKLLKSLHGLKQAPRNWNKNIVDHIKSLGFRQCVADNCLFVKRVGGKFTLYRCMWTTFWLSGQTWTRLNESSNSSLNTMR